MKIIENGSWLKTFDPSQLVRQIIQNESYTHDFNPNRGYIRFSNGFTIQWVNCTGFHANRRAFASVGVWARPFSQIFAAVAQYDSVDSGSYEWNFDLDVVATNKDVKIRHAEGKVIGIGVIY